MSCAFIAVQILPCVVFRAPPGHAGRCETMLAIPHRSERLPVTLVQQGLDGAFSPSWRCADGLVEQLSIPSDHPDAQALWKEIIEPGLLVSEFLDTCASEASLHDMAPVGHWILDLKGSAGWLPESCSL